jgi:DNA-binding CsgD family transcriptional regulator
MAASEIQDPRPNHRQLEIIQLYAVGKTREEIADELYLSRNTVKWYLADLRERLGARNTVHAVVLCISAGYLHVDAEPCSVDVACALEPREVSDLVAA